MTGEIVETVPYNFKPVLDKHAGVLTSTANVPYTPILRNILVFTSFGHMCRCLENAYGPDRALALLRTGEAFPRSAFNVLPFHFAMQGATFKYDDNGRITSVVLGDDVLAGNQLKLIYGLEARQAAFAYATPDSVFMIKTFHQRTTVKGKEYLNNPSKSYKFAPVDNDQTKNCARLCLFAIGTLTKEALSVATLCSLKALFEDLCEMFEQLPAPEQEIALGASIVEMFEPSLVDEDFTGSQEVLKGLYLRVQTAIESISVSKMSMSKLANYLESIERVGRICTILTHVTFFLPRAVDPNSIPRSKSDNPVRIATIENVGPSCQVLTERQKPTAQAIRHFLASRGVLVYYSLDDPVMLIGGPAPKEGKKKRQKRKENSKAGEPQAHRHSSMQASLYQAIRKGISPPEPIAASTEVEEPVVVDEAKHQFVF